MAVTTKDFVTLVREQAAAIQGTARSLVDMSVGSLLRAITEANAAVVLWLQGLVLQLLAKTRAATSSDTDLDSWMADYGVARLAAMQATGLVTFARFTPTAQAVVPVGSKVQTADGSQQYIVVIDTSNATYNAALGGYVLVAGAASVTVSVQAVTAGSAANTLIGGVSTLSQAISGVDTVTNAAAFTNGVDAESDAALRARFVAYIASLSKATKAAVGYAITTLKTGVTYSLVENQTYAGAVQMDYFYVVVDDGTGAPSTTFLSTVSNAIDAVRPLCSNFGVFAPVVVPANVSLTTTTAAGYDHTATAALVATAITNYINGLGLGNPLTYTRLTQVAYDASTGVTNVSAVLLNGGTADVIATNQQTIKAGTVAIA
jgi:uncharacterized phage protein gp47/JayE